MKFKNLILPIIAIAIFVTSCGEKAADKSSFTVNGKLASDEYNGKDIYLQKMDLTTNEIVGIDTVTIENGTFTFNASESETPMVGLISFEGISRPAPFIMESGVIEMNIDSTRKVSIKGTEMNDQYQTFLNTLNNEKDDATIEDLQKDFFEYIKLNIKNPVGEYFLLNRGKMLNAAQLKELMASADPKIKGYANYDSLEKRLTALEATALGNMFIDLKGQTPEGEEISLSEYAGKGKYVLIDFWASWCPPCRKEMPTVVEAYAQYKDKGFEIVGVSLDDKNADWQKGIKDLNISWPQMSDLNGWKSDMATAYGVSSIPQTFLLDKDGKIIAKGLNADQLLVKLNELLN